MQDATPIRGLKNIGPTIAARFEAVGITTVGELRRIGPAEAYKRVREDNPGVTMPVCYYLYSLQGALDGIHWSALPSAVRRGLLEAAGIHRKAVEKVRRC